jgi:hypothetical protein
MLFTPQRGRRKKLGEDRSRSIIIAYAEYPSIIHANHGKQNAIPFNYN